jgi:hypothetical protein
MSYEERKGSSSFLYILAVIGALLVMNYTVKKVREYTQPPALGAERAAERAKALADTRAADSAALTTYAWQKRENDIVRVPIERAMELTLNEWQDPAAGRAKLIENLEKHNFVPSFE